MSSYQLDVPELRRRLDQRRRERGLDWKQVAAATGVSASTFSRLADGKRPDADALVTLLVWLDLDTDVALLIKPKETP
ncbi:MAG: helix-turn-helix domain-containing protein [Blastococcus sp.]